MPARRSFGWIFASIVIVAGMLPVLLSDAIGAPNDLTLVSRANGLTGVKGNSISRDSSISADGRFTAFQSFATNLPGDTDGASDIFIRDRIAGTTKLVSRANGATGAKSNGISQSPAISADGRFVAFATNATNLPGDTGSNFDVFRRDTVANTTVLVSRASGVNGAKAIGNSFDPSVSNDGRFVAFVSDAANLGDGDTDGFFDIFVRDLLKNTTKLVSRGPGVNGTKANNNSAEPSISADGTQVAFSTGADNLPDGSPAGGVYVRDTDANTTTLVSRDAGFDGDPANSFADLPSMSGDGKHVSFRTAATNLPDDVDGFNDIFVRDVQAGTTTLVSRADGFGGANSNNHASLSTASFDGRFVAFDTQATNLPDDSDLISDVFVRDVLFGTTTLVSRASGTTGVKGNAPSGFPSITWDGGFVAFTSGSSNLDGADTDTIEDVYVRELEVPPSVRVVPGGSCGAESGSMNLRVNDENTGAPSVTLTGTSSDQGVVPDANIVFSGSGLNRTVTITPTSTAGTAVVEITGSDPGSNSGNALVLVANGSESADDIEGSVIMVQAPYMVIARGGGDTVEIYGDSDDLICAGSGNDLNIESGSGDDTIDGGSDTDLMDGGDGKDLIRGGDGNDTLIGNAQDDTLLGGNGHDTMFGAQHDDTMTGGLGADRFSGGTGTDVATDFNSAQGDTKDGVP